MPAVPVPFHAGDTWRQRVESQKEYEVVRDGNVFATSLFKSVLTSSEHDRAQTLLAGLLGQYRHRPITDVFSGTIEENEAGSCFVIQSRHPVRRLHLDPERYLESLRSDLTLVHGIGRTTERRLKARGYATIGDLGRHPRFRHAAGQVLRVIGDPATTGTIDLVGSRHSRSDLRVLGAAALHESEDLIFIDIETLGLFSRPIILIGVGTVEGTMLTIRQYLLRDVGEEPAALVAALSHLPTRRPALVTYNGKAFDLPYLKERLAYYGLGTLPAIAHFDCLHFARAKWRGQLPSLRLSAIENALFGISRQDDVPGQMVPEFYAAYLATGNCGPLVPVVTHNRQDVLSLAHIFLHLAREIHGNC